MVDLYVPMKFVKLTILVRPPYLDNPMSCKYLRTLLSSKHELILHASSRFNYRIGRNNRLTIQGTRFPWGQNNF